MMRKRKTQQGKRDDGGCRGASSRTRTGGGVKSGNPGAVEYFYSALECNHSALRVLFEMPSKKLMVCPPQHTPEGGRWGVDMCERYKTHGNVRRRCWDSG